MHARRRGGQEEAVLLPPARLDTQAHPGLLLELVELQLAAAIRVWVARRAGKWKLARLRTVAVRFRCFWAAP